MPRSAGEAGCFAAPSLFCERWGGSNSPYINHFSSPDTIIPDQTNPQDLNRYSYVNNNPLRYNDPTGHMRVEETGSSKGSLNCNKYSPYCNNGKKKSKEELDAMHPIQKKHQESTLLITNFADGGRISSWEGPGEIDPVEWEKLLKKVGSDVHSFSTGWYDTPFYNRYGTLKGTGCFNGNCYDRSEINYIGEGEALAAMGFSKDTTHGIVSAWKKMIYHHPPSDGVIEMTDIGYDYYHEHYSEPSLSVTSLMMMSPVTAPALLIP